MSTMVVFRCPTTGHEIMSGILTDADSFQNIQKEEFAMKCPECGERHRWFVAEGQLALSDRPQKAVLPQFARIH
jgi:predicted RNA-binding Zn-ribbon protein involved in translation (DUF1610 family)